jgi:hypothetical protein
MMTQSKLEGAPCSYVQVLFPMGEKAAVDRGASKEVPLSGLRVIPHPLQTWLPDKDYVLVLLMGQHGKYVNGALTIGNDSLVKFAYEIIAARLEGTI